MGVNDVSLDLAKTIISQSLPIGRDPVSNASPANETTNNTSSNAEVNETDPKICHDPSMSVEGIAMIWTSQNMMMMEDGESNEEGAGISANNKYDETRLAGIEYPLIAINNRNIDHFDIMHMLITYDSFIPSIYLEINDVHQYEQRLNSTQMSGLIRVCMISPVDKVYKKILLNFRITSVMIDPVNPSLVTYTGEMFIDGFRETHTKHVYLWPPCPKPITCQQGNYPNANTWEMLHQIASETGLGFQATKQTKEISDRLVRHCFHQRYDQFIMDMLEYSGLGVENVFDAWVDVYGYITLVNVSWVMNNKNVKAENLTIMHNVGIHGTSNDTMDQKPVACERTLSDYPYMGAISNAVVAGYYYNISNDSVDMGTLEKIYTMNIGTTYHVTEETDIQTIQDSREGQHLELYNTGYNRPVPIFNFNDDKYTGLTGGYDINKQKSIRKAYLAKKRQTILNVVLRYPNFGLQRGTLVNLSLWLDPNDAVVKSIVLANQSGLQRNDNKIERDKVNIGPEYGEVDIATDGRVPINDAKLTGLYYIDGMTWEYKPEFGCIIQTLKCFEKGNIINYFDRIQGPLKEDPVPKQTLNQSPADHEEQNIV